MSCQIKTNLASQLSKHIGKRISQETFKISKNVNSDNFIVQLPVCDAEANNILKNLSRNDLHDCGINTIKLNAEGNNIAHIQMDSDYFVKNVIKSSISPNIFNDNPKKIIFEYSSPNIAKPFHVGHLRSTIVGNFLSNINSFCKNNVTRLNYLGDWGTQFGILKVGVNLSNFTDEDIRDNPMECLFQAYVKGNKAADSDNSIAIKARQIFNQLEKGEIKDLDDWKKYKEYTLNELKFVYDRIGTKFDDYHWESSYNLKTIEPIIKDLQDKGVLKINVDGQKVATVDGNEVPIIKSDGSSLYLSRDIAAALDRFSKYNFDEMIYIVDGSQSNHFRNLISILDQAGSPIAPMCKHINFGRIIGMSTRKGKAVFLKDILDEAKFKMSSKQSKTATTKVDLNDENVADILGTSAVIINDLKQRRSKNYKFSWEHILYNQKASGVSLQYVHCRLYSIEKNCGVNIPSECMPMLIREPEALELIQTMACFEDVIHQAKVEMEACILVTYLFTLSNCLHRAIEKLRIKNQSTDLAGQRLLLLHSARLTLKRGLEILGLKVLNQM